MEEVITILVSIRRSPKGRVGTCRVALRRVAGVGVGSKVLGPYSLCPALQRPLELATGPAALGAGQGVCVCGGGLFLRFDPRGHWGLVETEIQSPPSTFTSPLSYSLPWLKKKSGEMKGQ